MCVRARARPFPHRIFNNGDRMMQRSDIEEKIRQEILHLYKFDVIKFSYEIKSPDIHSLDDYYRK